MAALDEPPEAVCKGCATGDVDQGDSCLSGIRDRLSIGIVKTGLAFFLCVQRNEGPVGLKAGT
jgi:hypothetical protein